MLQNSSWTATNVLFLKQSIWNEQDRRDTAGETSSNSDVTFSNEPLYTDAPVLTKLEEMT